MKPLKTKRKKKSANPRFSMKLAVGAQKFLIASAPYVISLAVIGIFFGAVIAYALNSPAFQLQEVKILNIGTLTPEQSFKFCELNPGENLITLDLVNVQQIIKRKHPEFKEVLVHRVLPNRIEVMLKRRTPVAQVAYARYVQIDRDLVILPGSSVVPFKNLTIIEGVPVPREGLYVGVSILNPQAKKAIKLVELLKQSNILKKHALTKIDIGDPKNISLFVDIDIEIRIGSNHILERFKILDQTLKTVELDRSKIRYIDLRFDDVVIGPR
jgi:cell division septal protein FtsQ